VPVPNNIRRERYRLARELGYTSNQASKVRSFSSNNLQSDFQNKKLDIQAKPTRQRTQQERQQLRSITNYQQRTNREPQILAEIDSGFVREQNWSEWSSKIVNFPPSILRYIRRLNTDSGRLRNDHYGFRLFYYMYVENNNENEAEEVLADRYPGAR
jgi:hypothetical protein